MKKYLPVICLLAIQCVKAQTLLSNVPVIGGDVYAIERVGNTVYVGGIFFLANGLPDTGLVSFDATTGLLNSWAPQATGVTNIRHIGNKLIVGGQFLTASSQTRNGICIFDMVTGNLDPWSDTANILDWRQGIGVDGNYFYFGKTSNPFSSACRIRQVDMATETITSWQSDSTIHGDVMSILVEGNYVYVGGFFSIGSNLTVDNLCRFDKITGALDTAWRPRPTINSFGVNAIVRTNSNIFVGGDFDSIAGVSRKGVAGFDLNGNLTGFNQVSSSWEVLTLYGDGNYIWVGGNSYLLGGQSRYRIAQIRISNGNATCWNASATSNTWSTVQAIFVSGDTVYAGPFGLPELSVFVGSPLPQPPGDTISGPSSVVSSQVATYSLPFVSGNTYNWNVTGGSGSSTSNSINVTWGTGTSGTVYVIENNPAYSNCYGDTIILNVTISPSIGTNNLVGEKSFSVFPNPSNKNITVTTCEEKGELLLYDFLGKEVMKKNTEHEKQISFDISFLTDGIYLLQFKTENKVYSSKFVKE
jgi:hypothetical protein